MRCVVPGCKNDSRNNFKSEGITFHSFPTEPSMRKFWLEALCRPAWQPKERSTVCSNHFLPNDLFETASGLRKVRAGAVPVIALDDKSDTEPVTSKVCRMCLVICQRMFPIKKYNLDQSFERLTGLSLSEDERLPQSLCPQCATRLHNCDKFRDRSLRANSMMAQLLATHVYLTKNALKLISKEIQSSLHRKCHIPDHYDLILQHTDSTNDLKDTDVENKPKDLETIIIKHETDNEIFADDFSLKDDYTEALSDIEIAKEEMTEPQIQKPSSDIEITKEEITELDELKASSEKGFDSDDSLPLEVTRKKKKTIKEKKVKKPKPTEPKIDRRRKPFLNQDLNETLFTVTDLTVEEQLAEVLKRQETDNYKHSAFKCTECFKGFLDQEAYTSHMVRHTSECGEFKCDICKTRFKQSHALRKHITAHHLQRFSCNHCPYVTTHRQTARLHERWHKGTKYQCPHCNMEFQKFTTYMGHIRIKHPSDFVCELCGYSFVSAKGIELHKKLKHRGDDIVIPDDGPFCALCNVRFVSNEAHNKHMRVSARHSDTQRENNKPSRGRKRELDIDKLKGKETDDEDKRRMYPSQMRKVEGPISCEQCGMQLEDSRAYHGHFRRMHPDKNRTNYPSMKSPCMCEVCGRIFQSYALLKDHTWVHTGERPFKCEQCGKSFRMKQRLVAHRRVHSSERASYVCGMCGKHFSTHSNRQRHMFIHTGLKPFKCEMCGKGFKHASEKRAHVTYVHLKKPWPKRARSKRRQGSPTPAGASEMDIQPAWPACDPKLADIHMMEDKPIYYR